MCTGLDAYCGTTVANWEIQRVVVVPNLRAKMFHQADLHVQSSGGLYEGPGHRLCATPRLLFTIGQYMKFSSVDTKSCSIALARAYLGWQCFGCLVYSNKCLAII